MQAIWKTFKPKKNKEKKTLKAQLKLIYLKTIITISSNTMEKSQEKKSSTPLKISQQIIEEALESNLKS